MDKVISQTKYDRKQHKDFYLFHLLRRSGTIKFIGFVVVLMFIFAVGNTFNKDFTITENTSSMMMSWIMFAISLSVTPFMIISKVNNFRVLGNHTENVCMCGLSRDLLL